MTIHFHQLIKDITKVDLDDILSCWKWALTDMQSVVTVSSFGDLFLLGRDSAVYWLQTDNGQLTKVADSLQQYEKFLTDEDLVNNWFLPLLVENLLATGKTLEENEVYSYKLAPVLGGEYSVENLEPTDMSVHFAFAGQIFEKIRDLPDGTPVNIKYKPAE